jgi:DNA-binding HxlR family transcriptional regulator
MSSSQAISSKRAETAPGGVEVAEGLCPRFHQAVELIGRRWTGAIIRVLQPGPKRFNELLAAVPGISDRLLTERLRELEAVEIIRREVQPESPVRVQYELTCRGRELRETLDALGRWAERWIGTQA